MTLHSARGVVLVVSKHLKVVPFKVPFVHRLHRVKHGKSQFLKTTKKRPSFFLVPFFQAFRSRIYIVYSNTGNGCDLVLFIVQYWKKFKDKKKKILLLSVFPQCLALFSPPFSLNFCVIGEVVHLFFLCTPYCTNPPQFLPSFFPVSSQMYPQFYVQFLSSFSLISPQLIPNFSLVSSQFSSQLFHNYSPISSHFSNLSLIYLQILPNFFPSFSLTLPNFSLACPQFLLSFFIVSPKFLPNCSCFFSI